MTLSGKIWTTLAIIAFFLCILLVIGGAIAYPYP